MFSRTTLTDLRSIAGLANRLHRYPKIGLDTESSGPNLIHKQKSKSSLNLYRSELTGVSIALPGEWPESFYIPIGHKRGNALLNAVDVLFRALVEYQGITAIHNVKHELYTLQSGPRPFSGLRNPHCTQVLTWLLQEGVEEMKAGELKTYYGLKKLAKKHFGVQMMEFGEVTQGQDFSQLDPSSPLARDYACEDAEMALRLHDKLYPLLSKYDGLEHTYLNVELPFINVLRHMEDSGMRLDTDEHEGIIADLETRRDEWLEQWTAMFPDVSITSSTQLQALFKDGTWPKKGLKKGKSGDLPTDKFTLQRFLTQLEPGSKGHEATRIKLEFAQLNTLITTFGQAMQEKSWQYPDLRLHCEYLHTGTATGRLSSSYPNLQNIPARTKDGMRIRDAFVPEEGWSLVSADYSQIELRVLAHFNNGGVLTEGYRSGADVHQATASAIFGIPFDQVTPEQRGQGKTANFAVIYGAGAAKLADSLGLKGGKMAGKAFLEKYKAANPESFATLQKAAKAAEKRGYVRTLLGRIRKVKLAEAIDRYQSLRAAGHTWETSQEFREAWLEKGSQERIAGNTPIQGGARDIMMLGMLDFYRKMDTSRCRIVGQVHDDLITEMRDDYVEEGMRLKQECLENAYKLRVPLVAEPKAAKRWSGLK